MKTVDGEEYNIKLCPGCVTFSYYSHCEHCGLKTKEIKE